MPVTLPDPNENGGTLASVEAGVVRAVGSIGLATLASRILGFARDVVVARAFGAAFIPVFTDYLTTRPRVEFNRMVRAVAGALLLALCLVAALGILLAEQIVGVMAWGFSADQLRRATTLTRVMFPYLIFVGLAALAMGVLNAHRRFFTSALGPAVLNVGIIAAVLTLTPHFKVPIMALAVGVLVGGLGQFVIQLPEIRRAGVPLRPSAELSHPALGRIAQLLGPTVFGLAAVQLNVFVNTLLASLLPGGSISYLYYADRVVEFPLGVFGIAVATAALPPMAEQAARRDLSGFQETINFALRLSCFVAIPASAGLWLLREPITRVLFERGRFGPAETQATAWALGFYALGLTAFAAARIAAQAFYALGDSRTPVKAGIAAVALNVVVAVALMGPLQHGGLALAASASATANLAILLWLLRWRLGTLGGRRMAKSLWRVAVATAVMSAWCGLLRWTWPLSATGGGGGGGVARGRDRRSGGNLCRRESRPPRRGGPRAARAGASARAKVAFPWGRLIYFRPEGPRMLLFPQPAKDASARAGHQRPGPHARGVGVFPHR
ncbi:MAG: murein biosynthesis integral membrane protein MurJ [Candidatus Rokubacteria bacterium]|nr:murein biosynthesis integral membrane protein MurJ [Candidatus Rokubacteria bacterium]